jgi:hypothetical protein
VEALTFGKKVKDIKAERVVLCARCNRCNGAPAAHLVVHQKHATSVEEVVRHATWERALYLPTACSCEPLLRPVAELRPKIRQALAKGLRPADGLDLCRRAALTIRI